MSAFYLDNAMAWAQFRLKGGWKNVLTVVPVIFAALVAIAVVVYESNTRPRDRADAMMAMTGCLVGLQCIVLFVVCTMRLRSAVTGDLASRRIESHRLMPLSPRQAVIGYISGGLFQLIMISLSVFIVGCGTSMFASIRMQTWVTINLLLLACALLIWCATIMMAFVMRGFFWIFVIFACIVFLTRGLLLYFVPGLMMLCTPLLGSVMFSFRAPSAELLLAIEVSVAAQIVLSLLCIGAASRKYTRDEALAWPVPESFAVLCIWCVLSCYGASHFEDVLGTRPLREIDSADSNPLAIGSIISSIIVAALMMSGAAWSHILAGQKHSHNPRSVRRHPLLFPITLALAVAAITALAFIQVPHITSYWCWIIAITSALTLTQIYLLMRLLYPRFAKANLMIAALVAVQWFVPMVMDLVYYTVTEPNRTPHLDHFGPISPFVLCLNMYSTTTDGIALGIVSQAVILALVLFLFFVFQSRPTKQTIAPPAPPLPLPATPLPLETPANQA